MKTVHLDYETRSTLNLKDCGLDRYMKHPSTQPLMCAYAFDDGPVNMWCCWTGEAMPAELRAALLNPTVKKGAWNYNFERDCTEYKAGIPIPQGEWFDPSVLCAYMSLPIGLDRAARALGVEHQKMGEGKKYVKMFSSPTKATKKMLKNGSPEFYFKDWNSHPEEWAQFVEYCRQDVEAERAVYHAAVALNCPMTDEEHAAWLLDQRMNATGVFIDQQYVINAKKLAEAESNLILAEIKSHTGLDNPNSRDQLIEWCQARKYPYDSLDKEHIEEALKYSGTQLPPLLRTVLELKQKLGGSAYKKLESILERMGIDGRLRDQFIYHGAHTGRWAGRGVQLQNLFKPNKDVSKFLDTYTRAIRLGKKIISRNSQMALVASTIRSSFAATPGHRLVVGDLAQIESRALAVLAQCQKMKDAYAAGRDLYKECMSAQLGKPIDQIDSTERARGKIIILGCFGANTPVLTQRGWIPITTVTSSDYVFDGVEWVTHGGVIDQGRKDVIYLNGVEVTPDHLICTHDGEWREAWQLKQNILFEQQALNLAVGSLSKANLSLIPKDIDTENTYVSAKDVETFISSMSLVLNSDERIPASPVPTLEFKKKRTEYTYASAITGETMLTDWQTAIMRLFPDVEELVGRVSGMEDEASNANLVMSMISYNTAYRWKAGIIQNSTSTDETTMATTPKEISALSPTLPTYTTDVFDILNAGPRKRFMILTSRGPMIVHNCGFQMGWEKFQAYALTYGIKLSEEEAKDAVYGFRETYHEIPALWAALNSAVIRAVKAGMCVFVNGLVVDGRDPRVMKIKLPSGRCLHYFEPKVIIDQKFGRPQECVVYTQYDSKGSRQSFLYGGLLTENVVQAIARDILLNAMFLAEEAGFVILATIHDEIVTEVPIDSPLGLEDLLACMTKVPEWGSTMGFTLAAEGYCAPYYRK